MRAGRLLAALAGVALLATSAQAYVVLKTWSGTDKKWGKTNVPWYVSSNLMNDVSEAQLIAALQGAFDAWQAVDCATISFTYGGKKTSNPGNGIYVRFVQSTWDPSVGDALAYSVSNNGSSITDNEVVFNAATAEWSVSNVPGKNDIQGVATHEIGHSIGLDHARWIDSTMFFSGGSIELRTLEEDDARGACYLYPAVAFDDGQACDACATSAHCASGVCLDWGGGHAYCGQDCASSGDCPTGFSCYNIQGVATPQCIPDNEFCHQEGNNLALGEFCYGHETCASGLCLVVPGDALCSQQCSSSCPAGFTCQQGYCLKAGTTPYGGACVKNSDCQSALCIKFVLFAQEGLCTTLCGDNGGSCPGGQQCYQNAVCVPPGTGQNGTSCTSATQCEGTYCIDGKCTEPCSSDANCPDGTVCSAGYCAGTAIGGACASAAECPVGQICHDLTGSTQCGRQCNALAAVSDCPSGEVCQWWWDSAAQKIEGVCRPATGGLGVGEPCGGGLGSCELDLVCHPGEGTQAVCRVDCKLQANNLGCTALEKCLSLDDPKNPKRGVCVDKFATTPTPDEDPGLPDATGTPDEGPGTPDEGPAAPDEGPAAPDEGPGPGDPDVAGTGGGGGGGGSGSGNSGGGGSSVPANPTQGSGGTTGCQGGGGGAGGGALGLGLLGLAALAVRRRRGAV